MTTSHELLRETIKKIINEVRAELPRSDIDKEEVRAAIQNYIGKAVNSGVVANPKDLLIFISDIERAVKENDISIVKKIQGEKSSQKNWFQKAALALPTLKMLPLEAFRMPAQVPSTKRRK